MKYEIYLCAQVQGDKEADTPSVIMLIFRFWFKILSGEGQRDMPPAEEQPYSQYVKIYLNWPTYWGWW